MGYWTREDKLKHPKEYAELCERELRAEIDGHKSDIAECEELLRKIGPVSASNS